ncbi:MAG: amidase [Acidimicrobiales bacterium]
MADVTHRISRRAFLGMTAAGGAALSTGALPSLVRSAAASSATAAGADEQLWLEASIPRLQKLMRSRRLTSQELTAGYLARIDRLNPLLHAVIETNPDALAIARRRDAERRAGHIRGPLHGIPVLVKDNIATRDRMETTAGSLALVGSRVPADAAVVARLRAAGAVILGKANLSEWANFRGFAPFNGWSARGGFTRNPYVLDFDPCGSSSGSAVAAAANLCSVAVGTETDGSITCPSGNNLIVGLKPTLGLVPPDGIIPIAHSQDTAGPMTRTVTDAAILFAVLSGQRGSDEHGDDDHGDDDHENGRFGGLRKGALRGARIGVDRRYFTATYGGVPEINAVVEEALAAMESLGATVIDTDTGDQFLYFDAEFTVLLYEFKVQVAEYLAGLQDTSMRTLADLIAFNQAQCGAEMKYFGQEIFEMAEATSGDLTDAAYLDARALCLDLTRAGGIDGALARDRLDAIVAPSYSYATSPAAVAGYPDIAVPVGLTATGKPAGIWMYSTARTEKRLLAFAYDLEQEMEPRTQPGYLNAVPPEPPDAGICSAAPATAAFGTADVAASSASRPRRPAL